MGDTQDESLSGQPNPEPTDGPSMHDLVIADLAARKEHGLRKYGTLLQANNGRSATQDAYEEALDLACYLRQALEEERIQTEKKIGQIKIYCSHGTPATQRCEACIIDARSQGYASGLAIGRSR